MSYKQPKTLLKDGSTIFGKQFLLKVHLLRPGYDCSGCPAEELIYSGGTRCGVLNEDNPTIREPRPNGGVLIRTGQHKNCPLVEIPWERA